LQVIIFQEQIFERLSLGTKETIIEADSCQKYEDLIQKYWCKDSCQKYEYLIQKYHVQKNLKILYNNMTRGAPPLVLLQLLLLRQTAYFNISDLEPMVFCAAL